MRELTAKDVMTRQVLTVPPDLTVHELSVFLIENQISGAPVVDERGGLLGLVSLTDIAESDALRDDVAVEGRPRDKDSWRGKANADEVRGFRMERPDLVVRDIMTPAAYTVPEDTPVATLAQTMLAGRIHRLVVTREHAVVGIVTSLDLLKLLVNRPPLTTSEAPAAGRSVIVR